MPAGRPPLLSYAASAWEWRSPDRRNAIQEVDENEEVLCGKIGVGQEVDTPVLRGVSLGVAVS